MLVAMAAIGVTRWLLAKLTARWVATRTVRCPAWASGEVAGLSRQLYSQGSM